MVPELIIIINSHPRRRALAIRMRYMYVYIRMRGTIIRIMRMRIALEAWRLVFSEEWKQCACRHLVSEHKSIIIWTQLQFLSEHKSACKF